MDYGIWLDLALKLLTKSSSESLTVALKIKYERSGKKIVDKSQCFLCGADEGESQTIF